MGQAERRETDDSGDAAALKLDEHDRPEPPVSADETTMILAYLDYHRATFAWKCRRLGSEGLNTRTAASAMSRAG
jgi:hypothetical protein